jgi:hypothetical protein
MSDTGDTHPVWNKETLLDALVNVVPLGILLFFIAVFALATPGNWGEVSIVTAIQFAIMGIMFVALAILTYLIAERI